MFHDRLHARRAPSRPRRRRRAARRGAAALILAALQGCGGPTGPVADREAPPPAPSAPGAVGSGRQSAAEPPRVPSAVIGLQLFRQGDVKGAEPHLVGALRESPSDRRLLEALGTIYARSDRWTQAEASFRAALAIDPSSVGARLGLAGALIDMGRYDEARREIDILRARIPDDRAVILKGALVDVRRGDAATAEAGARRAVALGAEDAEAHYVLGLALLQQERFEEADRELRRVLQIAPDHPGALGRLPAIATRLGRPVEAERFRRLQEAALSRRRVEERVRGHRLKGVEAFNRGDYPAALGEFQAIAREDPGDPQVHLHLGTTYLEMRRLDEAREALERSLSLDPGSERALTELGRMHALANRLDEAVAALEKAAAANPQFPEPHYYLAGIYMALGRVDESQEERRRFEELRARSRGAATEVIPAAGGRP